MINKYLNNEITIEELVLYYDKSNYTPEEIKAGGVVYTPYKICIEIIERLSPLSNETIFEPSLGHGIFVFALLEYMEDKTDNLKEYFLNYVYGGDIQENNIKEFKDIAIAFFNKKGISIDISEMKNFLVSDSLNNKTHYDIIFGNPPYIKIQNLKSEYREELRSNYASCEKGNIDIYYAFIELAYKYSKRASYIVPNSWLFNKSADILRKLIKDRLTYVVDFKEVKKFETAGIYTSIFQIEENQKDTLEYCYYDKCVVLDKQNLDKIIIENKLIYDGNPIFKYHTPIATLRDSIFTKKTKDSIALFKLSKVKNEGDFLSSKKEIIFPYTKDFKIRENLSKETFEYLETHKEELGKRDKGNKTYEAWFAYGRRQGFSSYDFTNHVIVIPGMISVDYEFFDIDLSKVNEKFLITSGFLLELKKENVKQVIDFLNSQRFNKFLQEEGKIWPGAKDKNYYSLTIKKIKEVFGA